MATTRGSRSLAWSWLPGDNPAYAAALATALLGALGALALHAACRAWGARPLAATAAVAIYAAAPAVVRATTVADVVALDALVVALVLWLAARGGPARGAARVGLLVLVAGVGLAGHVACALVAPPGGGGDVLASLGAWLHAVVRGWWYLPPIAGVAWLARACARGDRDPAGKTAWAWRGLAAAFVLCGPVLAACAGAEPRADAMSLAVLAPAVAVALDRGLAWLGARARLPGRLASPLAHVAFALAIAPTVPAVTAAASPAYETGVRNLLRSLLPGAVVRVGDRDLYLGAVYLQRVAGERPDVAVEPAGDGDANAHACAELLAAGKPVFVDPPAATVARELPTYPYGIVLRVLPAGASVPSAAEQFAIEQHVFDDYDLDYALPGPHDELATAMHERYAAVWQAIASGLHAVSNDDEAEAADQYAQRIGPHP